MSLSLNGCNTGPYIMVQMTIRVPYSRDLLSRRPTNRTPNVWKQPCLCFISAAGKKVLKDMSLRKRKREAGGRKVWGCYTVRRAGRSERQHVHTDSHVSLQALCCVVWCFVLFERVC